MWSALWQWAAFSVSIKNIEAPQKTISKWPALTVIVEVCENDSSQQHDSVFTFCDCCLLAAVTNNPLHLSVEHILLRGLSSHPCFFLMYRHEHWGAGASQDARKHAEWRKRLASAAIPFPRECTGSLPHLLSGRKRDPCGQVPQQALFSVFEFLATSIPVKN